jgi:hypothetical protein
LLGPIDLYNGDPDPHLGGLIATKTFLGSWWEPGDNQKAAPRHGVDWIIVGGESGPGARPMHPDWARSLRDQCNAVGVPFFFKQWGEWNEGSDFLPDAKVVLNDGTVSEPTRQALYALDRKTPVPPRNPTMMRKAGKKAAGRLLDSREWNEIPQPAQAREVA